MKIAVLAANGKSGRAIVAEALRQGRDVVAFVRGEFVRDEVVKNALNFGADANCQM